ncbi:MAG TPA: HDIG domain-containing protein [Treponemataceae bacterium]|nr:HDIG domain-containing protein [Treponemataceae bacterium]
MNKKTRDISNNRSIGLFLDALRRKNSIIILLICAFIALSLSTYFSYVETNGFSQISLVDFAVDKVADRDVVASREVSYVDENATRIRREAKQRLVTAVFKYDRIATANMVNAFVIFQEFLVNTMQSAKNANQFVLEVQQEYPGILDRKQLQNLYASSDRIGILSVSMSVFKQVASEGITTFPEEGLEKYNKSEIELVRWKNERQERIEVSKDSLLTWNDLRNYSSNALTIMKKSPAMTDTVLAIIKPFLKDNVIYQAEESEAKLDAAVRQVSPVQVILQKGQKIIRRGYLITEENYAQLEALASSGVYLDVRQFAGTMLWLLVIAIAAAYFFGSGVVGINNEFRNILLLVLMFCALYLVVLVCSKIQAFSTPLNLAVIIPAAMLAMLITVLMGQRAAIFMTFLGSFGVLCASSFDLAPMLFTILSGIAGVSVMRITGKRIDLVKSACILAAIQPLIALIIGLILPGSIGDVRFVVLGTAINGFMSGILVIGFLPILEAALNTSTSFRLMEFSDLNSPIMKRMLLSVSGTYNHSIMVATLAESACREIGADPLLARVGAYYHDIGKMDQSDYFVENQTDYNKHLDLNPRLSATVIRSHVKQGVEKARQMRLPREVIDIISEHHGNSVIAYFYNEAKKTNDSVDPEDFMYPGTPPRSKESAVVMLADVVEAACRTLEKPSVPRLEKFINELVGKKIETNQLDNCELTFREIGIIKRTFVNILAGYYHTRIEYPNQKDPDATDSMLRDALQKGKKQ